MDAIADDRTLADIVTGHPAAAAVFHRHHLDYCCRGTRAFAAACADRGLDPAAIRAEIREAERSPDGTRTDWSQRPLGEVIDHILARYHRPLREELRRLAELAAKVERVHGEKPACPHGLADHLAEMIGAVEDHLVKEEEILFPIIRHGHGPLAEAPVRLMVEEHERHGESLARVRELTGDLVPPPEACASWIVLYRGLEELERDLMDHIHLENHVLFPRALAG